MSKAHSIRDENLARLNESGFTPATWMPLPSEPGTPSEDGYSGGTLRPAEEIATRYCCHFAVFAWGSAPADLAPLIGKFIEENCLREEMTAEEQKILSLSKTDAAEEHAGTVGWRLENMWSLAWILGFAPEPSAITGQLPEEISGGLLGQFLPNFDTTVESIVAASKMQDVEEVIRLEDLFYLAHNAVRGGQLDQPTVPPGFDPIADGGAIHERRHSLTWALSPGVSWSETDLST